MKSNLDGSTIASVDLIGLGGRNPLGFWEGGGSGRRVRVSLPIDGDCAGGGRERKIERRWRRQEMVP